MFYKHVSIMPLRAIKLFSLMAVSVCFAGTTFVADAQTRSTDTREVWTYVSPYYDSDSAGNPWWTNFGDSTLDSLISIGRSNSYDIAAAIKRVDAAKALIGMAKSGYFPTVDISAGWTKERMSGMTTAAKVPSTTTDFFNASASASWEIDIFGKVRAGVNQKKASYRATRAESEGVMLSVTAEIATTYFNYRVAQNQLAVALDHSASQLKLVRIAEARHETGLASSLDVAQAKTVYYSTLSTISPLRARIHTLRNSLALLTGSPANALPVALDSLAPLPESTPIPLSGVPADIIRRRPDIMQSEQNVSSAAAAVGIAKKDFLPTLSINGSIGTSSHDAGNLFKSVSFTYSVAPTLSWTLFSGFSRKYAVAEAKAQMEALIQDYNYALQNAYFEVDNAIFTYSMYLATITDLNETENQSHIALTRSVDLYKTGNSNFTTVADAQMSFLTYTNNLITARGNALNALVSLYKAIGGGFSEIKSE